MSELLRLADEHPVVAFLFGILMLFAGALGVGPLRAVSRQLKSRADTGANAELIAQTRARRTDNIEDSYQGIALRAINEKNEAIDQKNTQAAAHAEAMHAFNNRAQAEIGRIQAAANDAVRAAEGRERIAADRAVAAEATVRALTEDVTNLNKEVARLNRRLDALTGFNSTDIGGT